MCKSATSTSSIAGFISIFLLDVLGKCKLASYTRSRIRKQDVVSKCIKLPEILRIVLLDLMENIGLPK